MSLYFENDEVTIDIGTGLTFLMAWDAIKQANRWKRKYYKLQKKYRALLKKEA